VRPDVLEHNLRALLRRSYVPALPAPLFRDRLEALFLGEVARRAPRPARRTARPWLILALAAGVLAALLGWRFLAADGPATRARLLERGAVALGLPDGRWRAADEEERVHGLVFTPPTLVVVTPEGAELELLVASGRVHLAARSELALERRGADDYATLRAGEARFHLGEHEQALELGLALALRAPTALDGAPLAERSPPAGVREAVPAPPATASVGAEAAERALTGSVVDAESGAPLTDFTVALLRERIGNATPPPEVRAFHATDPPGEFRWPAPPAGKQRVFVHAAGYALEALGEFELGDELPALRARLERGVSVSGSVLDAHGAPVADALVLSEQEAPSDGLLFADSELAFWLPIQARTGPDGRFELAHLHAGAHTLRASGAGFAPSWSEVRAPRDAHDGLVLTLRTGGAVEGTVTRADGGPWAEAEIVVVAMDQASRTRTNFALAHSDAAGHYRVEHLPATTMIVVLLRADERPDVRPVQVEEGLTARADFGPPEHGLRLFGRVLRGDAPVARQNVGLFDREQASWNQQWVASSTQADGSYEFAGVQPGRYLVFLIDEMGRGLRCVDELALGADGGELEHDVHVSDGRIALTLRDARRGTPVADAAVVVSRLQPDGAEEFMAFGLSLADGSCAFADLAPGSYRLSAYPSGGDLGYATSETLALAEAGRAECALELGEGGAVTVRVRSSDGQPLEHAVVTFVDEAGLEHGFSRLPLTDAEGRYRAAGLRPGRYRVRAQLAGYEGAPVALRFDLGLEAEVPVLLTPLTPR